MKEKQDDNVGIGVTTGIVIGFLEGLFLNSIILIPIALGVGYDKMKDK